MTAMVAVGVDRFDQLPEPDAIKLLLGCAKVPWWAQEVVARRPYGGAEALMTAAADLMGQWSWTDVAEAMAAHQVGESVEGGGAPSSRAEQAGVGDTLAGELRAVHEAYQRRFGRALLIRPTGRSASEILRIGLRRLQLDEQAERAATTREFRDIVRRRLRAVIA